MKKFVASALGVVLTALLTAAATAGPTDAPQTMQDRNTGEQKVQKDQSKKTDQHLSRRNKALLRVKELKEKRKAEESGVNKRTQQQ